MDNRKNNICFESRNSIIIMKNPLDFFGYNHDWFQKMKKTLQIWWWYYHYLKKIMIDWSSLLIDFWIHQIYVCVCLFNHWIFFSLIQSINRKNLYFLSMKFRYFLSKNLKNNRIVKVFSNIQSMCVFKMNQASKLESKKEKIIKFFGKYLSSHHRFCYCRIVTHTRLWNKRWTSFLFLPVPEWLGNRHYAMIEWK